MNPVVLKCLLGLGAVGAAGAAGAVYLGGGFSWGGKGDQNKEPPNVQNEVSDKSKTSHNETLNKDTAKTTDDNLKNPPPLQLFEKDDLGLPSECETTRDCTLDKEKIKKVKFQALGDGKVPVEVTGLADKETISVIVEGDGDNKRYIFNNESNQITLSKDSSATSLELPQGKTRFIDEKKKLKKLELGKFGLPKICETKKSCKLTSSDLETIKFSDFEDEEESFSLINAEGLDRKKTISLTIEDNKYIFDSPSSVDIKRTGGSSGSATVQLDQGDTEFKVEQGKLKKLEPGKFGLPEECEYKEGSDPITCSLSSRDLKKIKFNVFGNSPTVSGLNNNEKVSLKIQKVEDSSFPDGREYIFTKSGSGDVTITYSSETTQTITLSSGDNTFKKERGEDFLVEVPKRTTPTQDVKALDTKISGIGLPKACTFTNKASGNNKSFECELSHEELKKLKFSGEGDQSIAGGLEEVGEQVGDPKVYKLKIEDFNESQFGSKNIRVTFLSEEQSYWSKNLVISFGGSGESIVIANKTDTEFKINDQSNKLEKVWGETNLSEQVGLKCPKENRGGSQPICTLKEGEESIKVLIGGEAKDFKPSNTSDLENNMTYDSNNDGLNQGLKFTVKTKITGTNASDSQALELATGTYQIKRIPDKGWRFTNK